MRLYNQTRHELAWNMGRRFTCEPYGAVNIPDDLVHAVKSRGLPLDVNPVAPELRAQARIAEQQETDRDAPLHALKRTADDAQAAERSAKGEIERLQVELNGAREESRSLKVALTERTDELGRAVSEKNAAESLLSEAGKRATDAEERAIKAEAVLAELQKEPASQPKGDKPEKSQKPSNK